MPGEAERGGGRHRIRRLGQGRKAFAGRDIEHGVVETVCHKGPGRDHRPGTVAPQDCATNPAEAGSHVPPQSVLTEPESGSMLRPRRGRFDRAEVSVEPRERLADELVSGDGVIAVVHAEHFLVR